MRKVVACLLFGIALLSACLAWFAPAPVPTVNVADPEVLFDSDKLDPQFPDMSHWARAGVQNGIPHREDTPIVKELSPGNDLQTAINAVAAQNKRGVILLSAGRHPITQRLDLKSNVILRGTDRTSTILENRLRSHVRNDTDIVGICFRGATNAGLEELTITHPVVEAINPVVYEGKYENNINGIDDLLVGHLNILKSVDCWVDGCQFLFAGTDPIIVDNSVHITLRGNLVKGSFNKGGDGNGYYEIRRSQYVLCASERVIGIRHFSIQEKARYNVVLDSYFEVDVNFHGLDGGHNLIENCWIAPRAKWWAPLCHYSYPTGEGNLAFQIHVPKNKKGEPGRIYGKISSDPNAVFALRILGTNEPQQSVVTKLPNVPLKGTLYPMACSRRSPIPTGNQ